MAEWILGIFAAISTLAAAAIWAFAAQGKRIASTLDEINEAEEAAERAEAQASFATPSGYQPMTVEQAREAAKAERALFKEGADETPVRIWSGFDLARDEATFHDVPSYQRRQKPELG